MYTDTLHSTPAPNKPSASDDWFAGWVSVAIQDRKYLDSLPPDQRDKTTKALSDLEVLLRSSSERETDAARERLAQTLAAHVWRVIDPEVSWALKERVQRACRNTEEDVKLEAMRVGLFLALTQLSRVQKVQLGQTRDTVVVDDGILTLLGRDGSVRDGYAGLTHLEPLPRPMSAVRAVYLSYGSWLRDAQDRVFVAFVGPTRPVDLRAEHRLHWLRCRAIRHAEEWILDGQLSPKRWGCDIADLDLADNNQCVLDALVATEEVAERLVEVYDLATPKQRQILLVLDEALASGLDIPDAKRLAAEELGIEEGTINTALSRLRTRVRAANRL